MAREIKIYNSLTHQKEILKPLVEGEIKFYSCGPTTYDYLHVGNARALVVGDLFYRILRQLEYRVTFVRNFTDIDDKIIAKAKACQRDPIAHAALFVDECWRDMDSLGMEKPHHSPKVTETIPEIIAMISKLLEKKIAYQVGGEVLYHVPHFSDYGKLSKKDLENLQHGLRVEVDEHKRHPSDFVLWKPAKEGEPAWDSPFGAGRPGWHIECSAMAKKFLGETIDLHHGGIDLIFPHHENEIAQSEAAHGQTFCSHWCHNEFLQFASEKMSKSLGNVITIRHFVEKYGGPVLRQIFLSTHYRAPIKWSQELIEKALGDVERIHQFVVEVGQAKVVADNHKVAKVSTLATFEEKILLELSKDFNAPGAMAKFFTMIRNVRRESLRDGKLFLTEEEFAAIKNVIGIMEKSLGAVWPDPKEILDQLNIVRSKNSHSPSAAGDAPSEEQVTELIKQRQKAKEEKNWGRADEIRKELGSWNILLLDHPDGTTTWKFK